ncbi:hypothetical protein ACFZDJ_47735 [Streptomyces sp. NPDC007896]|uniref:hypothetical protein n=1 Tax=Streptomyces sp. NPDC007896 TaxID=3364784 RepID=UPI0036E955FB
MAEATGLTRVTTLHVVRGIALYAKRRRVLSVDHIDAGGAVQEKTVIANAVFPDAGSPVTTWLMVKSPAKVLVPGLPEVIGTQWGNGGDRICARTGMPELST